LSHNLKPNTIVNPPIKVAIAEDHKVFRKVFTDSINKLSDMEVVFGAGDGMELIEMMRESTIDVLILDLNMPILDGKQALDVIRVEFPGVRVIILSLNYSDELVQKYMRMGVRGYLCKSFEYEIVLDAIRDVYNHGYFFHDKVSRELMAKLISNQIVEPDYREDHLTKRELTIIKLISQEKINNEISEELNISVRTVQNHRLKISKKTDTRNAVGILVYALRNGIYRI
jgi:DNA-binding NarL/FixJ family response regulator